MKIRQAKKILNMMAKGTDTRYFDSKYTFKKESRFIPRLKNLYQKATIRWNKVNMPSANVSLFRSILRTSKECSRCKHFNGMLAGRCTNASIISCEPANTVLLRVVIITKVLFTSRTKKMPKPLLIIRISEAFLMQSIRTKAYEGNVF